MIKTHKDKLIKHISVLNPNIKLNGPQYAALK